MAGITGTYCVDVENSAKLKAGFFHERFVMKPGFDDAIRQYMLDHAHLVNEIFISIDPQRLAIRSHEGEFFYSVLELDETSTPPRLVVKWDDKSSSTFTVVEVAPGSIHLQNPNNELGECIWRRIDPA